MLKTRIYLIVVDVRSAYNVGSLLRTADAMAVEKVFLAGISPHPAVPNDNRLPHVILKAELMLSKTALGAEKSLDIEHVEKNQLKKLFIDLRAAGFEIAALEQAPAAKVINNFRPPPAIALVVGNEVKGLDVTTLALVDYPLAIPMLGTKESLNVAIAAGMALYHLRFALRQG